MKSRGPLTLLVCSTPAVLNRSMLFGLNGQQLLAVVPNRCKRNVVNYVQSLTSFTRTLLTDPLIL